MKYWKKYKLQLIAGSVAGFCGWIALDHKDVVLQGGQTFLWGIGQYCLLVTGYTLAWFLMSALMFLLGGNPSRRAGITMSTAAVFGLFSSILHAIVCHFLANICVF